MAHPLRLTQTLDRLASRSRTLLRAAPLAGLVLLSACNLSSPTEPGAPALETATSHTLTVQGFAVRVDDQGCGGLDLEKVRGELETAYRRGVREYPPIAETGYASLRRVVFRPGVPTGHYAEGSHELVIGCGNYGAVEHEPGHFWGDLLDLGCWRDVWHSKTLACTNT